MCAGRTPGRDVFGSEGLIMPSLHFRFLPTPADEGSVVSFHVDHEGAFLWVWPFEIALLWPGVQS